MAEKDQEYSAMYYGFTPGAFADTIFNTGNEATISVMKAFSSDILVKCDPANVQEYSRTLRNLTAKTEQNQMLMCDKLKFALESYVFDIPRHVLLDEDLIQDDSDLTEEQEKTLDAEIEETKQKIFAARFTKQKLGKNKTENESLLKQLEEVDIQVKEQTSVLIKIVEDVNEVLEALNED